MSSSLIQLINNYETELKSANENLSIAQLSQEKHDFIQYKYPSIIKQLKEILGCLENGDKTSALRIVESNTMVQNDKNVVLGVINGYSINTNNLSVSTQGISHQLDITITLDEYILTNQIDSQMSWEEISGFGVKFYESRLKYELDLLNQGFIFKNLTKDSLTEIINNNTSLLHAISNRMSLKNFTQDNMNDLTRDINYLSHYPLRKIFIEKYKFSKFRSTGFYQLTESDDTQAHEHREIEQFPTSFNEQQINSFIQDNNFKITNAHKELKGFDDNKMSNDANPKQILVHPSPKAKSPKKNDQLTQNSEIALSRLSEEIKNTLRTELSKVYEAKNSNLQIDIAKLADELSKKIKLDLDAAPFIELIKSAFTNTQVLGHTNGVDNFEPLFSHIKLKIDSIEQKISNNFIELASELGKTRSNDVTAESLNTENFKITLENFQNNIHDAFTQYLEDVIIKQGTEAYEAAQVLEHNSKIMAEEITKFQGKLEATDSLMEETKKYLSFKSFKYHVNTILWSTLLMSGTVCWIFIWVGMQLNSAELNELRPLKSQLADACKIINSQEPKLKQNLLDTLKLQCSKQ